MDGKLIIGIVVILALISTGVVSTMTMPDGLKQDIDTIKNIQVNGMSPILKSFVLCGNKMCTDLEQKRMFFTWHIDPSASTSVPDYWLAYANRIEPVDLNCKIREDGKYGSFYISRIIVAGHEIERQDLEKPVYRFCTKNNNIVTINDQTVLETVVEKLAR
jgi:hypothetical protein